MKSGARHKAQRSNRVRLKADAVVLLDRLAARVTEDFPDDPSYDGLLLQISEMRMRLAPPPGIKAPIIRTGYTRDPS